jgi:predicted aldo/keto reductase-like oxidoreductase
MIVDHYDKWEFCQIQYKSMDTSVQAGTEGLRYAAAKGLGVVIMEPLLGGKLALDLPATRPLWESAEQEATPTDWALLYDSLTDSRFEYKNWIPDGAKAEQCVQCDECLFN